MHLPLLVPNLLFLLLTCCSFLPVTAFVVAPTTTTRPHCAPFTAVFPTAPRLHTTNHAAAKLSYDQVQEIEGHYGASVQKPLGVIFGENRNPFFGLVVDDVEPGLNGGAAGLRVGDQLLAVNGRVVVGKDFESTMTLLIEAPAEEPLQLDLFRGSVQQLYTIIDNKFGDAVGGASEDEEEDDDDVVIMDENYESPVVINVDDYQEDEEPLSVGDVFNAFKVLGSKVAESASDALASSKDKDDDESSDDKKKKGGLFGGMFGAESIQLEGDDAAGLK